MFTEEEVKSNLQSDMMHDLYKNPIPPPSGYFTYITTYASGWEKAIALLLAVSLSLVVIYVLFLLVQIIRAVLGKIKEKDSLGEMLHPEWMLKGDRGITVILSSLLILLVSGLYGVFYAWGWSTTGPEREPVSVYYDQKRKDIAVDYVNTVIGFDRVDVLASEQDGPNVKLKLKTNREFDTVEIPGDASAIVPGATQVQARWVPAVQPGNPPRWDSVTVLKED